MFEILFRILCVLFISVQSYVIYNFYKLIQVEYKDRKTKKEEEKERREDLLKSVKSTCWCLQCKYTVRCVSVMGPSAFICKKSKVSSLKIAFNSHKSYYEIISKVRRVRYCGCCHNFNDVINHSVTKNMNCDIKISETKIFPDVSHLRSYEEKQKERQRLTTYKYKILKELHLIIVNDKTLEKIQDFSYFDRIDVVDCPKLKIIDTKNIIINAYNCPNLELIMKYEEDYTYSGDCPWVQTSPGVFNDKVDDKIRKNITNEILSNKISKDIIINIINKFIYKD